VLTSEGIDALASYLRRRQHELGCTKKPILEVGAGSGRLAHLLNATGIISSRVLASDLTLIGEERFNVTQADATELVREKRPEIVLCAWMTFGSDGTKAWREAGVREYLLIGDLGDPSGGGKQCYSLSYEHPPYTRVIIEEVSRHLLHIKDARPWPHEDAPGSLCAVAYRK